MGYYTTMYADLYVDLEKAGPEVVAVLNLVVNGDGLGGNGGQVDDLSREARDVLAAYPGVPAHKFFQTPRFEWGLRAGDEGKETHFDVSTGHIRIRTDVKAYGGLYDNFLDWLAPYLDLMQRQTVATQGEDQDSVTEFAFVVPFDYETADLVFRSSLPTPRVQWAATVAQHGLFQARLIPRHETPTSWDRRSLSDTYDRLLRGEE